MNFNETAKLYKVPIKRADYLWNQYWEIDRDFYIYLYEIKHHLKLNEFGFLIEWAALSLDFKHTYEQWVKNGIEHIKKNK